MQLIFVAHRRRTAFKVGNGSALFSNDQGALKLACIQRIDTEIGGQFHRTFHALRDEGKGAIGKYGRIQRGKEIVCRRYHGAQILAYQFRMLLHGIRKGAEDHPGFAKLLPEGGGHGHRVEHGIHGHACQRGPLVQWNAKLLIGFQQLRVNLIQTFGAILFRFRR